MLQHVYIKNFALIDEVELELSPGATMITGETGAGKSIILSAIELALGARISGEVVKTDQKQAEIILTFSLSKLPEAAAWINERDLSSDDECILRRVIQGDGKNRSYINGSPTTLQNLKDISRLLVNIHGQHDNYELLKPEVQTKLIDAFADNGKELNALKECYQSWKSTQKQLDSLQQSIADSEQRSAFLQYQIDEFESAQLTTEEITKLPEQHKKLAHAEELLHLYQQALYTLSEDETGSLLAKINELMQSTQAISQHDASISQTLEQVNNIAVELEELHASLQSSQAQIELDPNQLAIYEKQMSIVHDMSRKHKITPEQLPEFIENMRKELSQLDNIDANLETLKQTLNELGKTFQTIAKKLTDKRQKACNKVNKLITQQVQKLGMPKAKFMATLINYDNDVLHPTGNEYIEFQVQTNPGSKPQAMSKIASGGELSRLSLALQVITAKHVNVPTLFFDEVDVGIGGTTAAIVGQLLHKLSRSHQVVCITHQPQVAACGDDHLHVSKTTSKTNAKVNIQNLKDKKRVEELARMLGGIKVTEQTLAHAEEMLDMQQN